MIDINPVFFVGLLVFLFLTVSVFVISLYIYVFYSHENERNFPGIKYLIASVVFTIYISIFTLIMVPLDYLNGNESVPNSGLQLGIHVKSIWQTMAFISFFSFILNVFWLQYYRYYDIYLENQDDPQIKKRVIISLKYVGKYLGTLL